MTRRQLITWADLGYKIMVPLFIGIVGWLIRDYTDVLRELERSVAQLAIATAVQDQRLGACEKAVDELRGKI